MSKPIFTVDWEPWFCHIPYCSYWEETDPLVEEPTMYLLDLLRRHKVRAVWYMLGWLKEKRLDLYREIKKEGHVEGFHTFYHSKKEADYGILLRKIEGQSYDQPFRTPRFRGQKQLYSGGFWFRAMPYWWSKRELLKSGTFYIHPHDLLWEHPKCKNPIQNFKRQIGLTTVRDKLERLMREVEFEDAREVINANNNKSTH